MEYQLSTLPLREVLADFPRESLSKSSMGSDEGGGRGRRHWEVWVMTKVEERWWLRADVEEEKGVEGGGWVGIVRICYKWVEEMTCIDGSLRGKTMMSSMHHTTLKFDVP